MTNLVDFGRKIYRLRLSSYSLMLEAREIVVSLVLLTITLVLSATQLLFGDFPITPADVWGAIWANNGSFAHEVVVQWRLPAALAAPLFGGALALSGLIFQRLTRNPLASPDVIGFATGAYTGALIVLTVMGGTYAGVTIGALVGGLGSAALVLVASSGSRGFGTRLIVIGIAVSAGLSGVNVFLLKQASQSQALSAAVWGIGSLESITMQEVGVTFLSLLVVGAFTIALFPALSQLELGSEIAGAQGVHVRTARLLLIGCSVALMAIVTSVAGPIAFIALVAPPIAARLTASATGWVAVVATGAFLLTAADFVARVLLPTALPVGVVTLVIGGGYLIWLLFRPALGERS